MFKILTYTFLIIVLFVPAFGQQLSSKSAVELRLLLQQSKPDSNRVLILHALSKKNLIQLFSTDKVHLMDTTIDMLDHAIRLCDTLQLKKLKRDGMYMRGEAYLIRGDIAEGKRLYQELAALFHAEGDLSREAQTWLRLGMVMRQEVGDLNHLDVYYKKAIVLYRQAYNSEGEAKAMANYGNYLFQVKKYDQAENEVQQALDVLNKAGSKKVSGIYYLLSTWNRYRGAYCFNPSKT